MQGEAGNDTYILENGADNVIDTAGIDTVTSTINRSLAASTYLDVENLTCWGPRPAARATISPIRSPATSANICSTAASATTH